MKITIFLLITGLRGCLADGDTLDTLHCDQKMNRAQALSVAFKVADLLNDYHAIKTGKDSYEKRCFWEKSGDILRILAAYTGCPIDVMSSMVVLHFTKWSKNVELVLKSLRDPDIPTLERQNITEGDMFSAVFHTARAVLENNNHDLQDHLERAMFSTADTQKDLPDLISLLHEKVGVVVHLVFSVEEDGRQRVTRGSECKLVQNTEMSIEDNLLLAKNLLPSDLLKSLIAAGGGGP